MKKYIFTEEQQKQITDLCLNNKWGYRRIAKELNISSSVVLRYMRENHLQGVKQRKHNLNENYFENINTPEKAYWLRLLYADGCVFPRRRTVTLIQKPDESGLFLLQEFFKAVENDDNIKIQSQNSWGTETKIARCEIYSKKMTEDLISKGCVPKKSLILKFPNEEIVNKDLQSHFIRGYFDGDGSLLYSKVSKKTNNFYESFCFSFVGTKEFLEGIKTVLNVDCKIFHDNRKNLDTNTWVLNIRGNQQAIKIGNFLYKDATIYLKRKYQLFQKLLENYQEK